MHAYRLSPQQRRVWRLQREAPQSAFAATLIVSITGPLRPDGLAVALRAVVNRHDILRAAFESAPGVSVPLQTIRSTPFAFDLVSDLPDTLAAASDRLIARWIASRGRNGFDLTEGRPLRVAWLRFRGEQSEKSVLAFSAPALCADAAGLRSLVRQIADEYAAGVTAASDSGDAAQYSDIAAALNELLESDETGNARAFWSRQIVPAPQLPFARVDAPGADAETDAEADAGSSFVPESITFRLGAPADRAWAAASFAALIHRLAEVEDVPLATVHGMREYEELRDTPGPLCRAMPIRVTVHPGTPFQDLVSATAATLEEAKTWLECHEPGLDESADDRTGAGADEGADRGAFQVDVDDDGVQSYERGGVRFTVTHARDCADRFLLKLLLSRDESGPLARLEYDPSRLDAADARRIGAGWIALLEDSQRTPSRPVGQLACIGVEERETLTQLAAQGGVASAAEPVLAAIARHARGRPDHPAVWFEQHTLSYADLHARGLQLARYLRKRGVTAGMPVGLCIERSLDLIAGILGIMYAGGAYVPLDPEYPIDRLSMMIDHAGIGVLVCRSQERGRFPDERLTIVSLDTDADQLARESIEPLEVEAGEDTAAYVIYTSGSTGTPKGVVISRRNLASSQAARVAFYRTDPARYLLLSSVSFDSSVAGLFWTLSTGGTLVLPREGMQRSPADVAALIAEAGVSHLLCLPSLYDLIVDQANAGALDSLRTVIVAGEPCPEAIIATHARRVPAAGLFNEYGPTEATVWSTVYDVLLHTPGASVSIGRPIANAQVHVVDACGELVPLGAAGELAIGGDGVARGYWQRPAETARRFQPDPFSGVPGARLYHTGDLVRWRPEGALTFLGRRDHQVKVRGFRIELGEIETVLARHPGVRQAVVIARDDAAHGAQLVAYVVAAPDATPHAGPHAGPTAAALRAHVRAQLPDYMVPAAFVLLAALPLTPNGKVDRKALPAPADDATGDAEAPRTPIEEIVAHIWAGLLRRGSPTGGGLAGGSLTGGSLTAGGRTGGGLTGGGLGRHADFFALGGHSLLATQVVARVRAALGVEVPLRTLFDAPTLAAFAAAIDDARRGARGPVPPPLRPVSRDGPIPLAFTQQRLWFLQHLAPTSAAYHLPAALRLRGPLDAAALHASLDALVARHEALRTTFPAADGVPWQRIAPPAPFAPHWIDLAALPADQRDAIADAFAAQEARRPFALDRGPLLRVHVLRLADDEHVLLVTLHHIICDGWSVAILVRELSAGYQAASTGARPPALPPLPVQPADVAVWQREWLAGDVLDAQLAYWRRQLAGAPVLDLPTEATRPAVASHRGDTIPVRFDATLTAALRGLAQDAHATLYMVLISAWALLLSRLSGQDDVVIGTPIAGRRQIETEGLIGCFINTLALRLDLTGRPTFHELLARVRATVLDAYAHQDLPFEQLVDALNLPRDLAREPLVQTMFILQNEGSATPDMGGLEIEGRTAPYVTSKFDLLLSLEEKSDGMHGLLEFATDLFTRPRIERLIDQWRGLLGEITAAPARSIADVRVMTDSEEAQLRAWSGQHVDAASLPSIPELIDVQIARTPDAVAVVVDDQHLTYAALNRHVNHLAARLRTHGVGPDVRVGVCMARGLDVLPTLLAIMRAGGAYVPLDPAYPAARIAYMLDDAAPRVLLVDCTGAAAVPRPPDGTVMLDVPSLLIDAEADAPADAPAEPIGVVSPEQLAYVLYTSGSTGQPKGVALTHASAAAFVDWARRSWPAQGFDGVLAATSLCFDLSIFELFVPLCVGGRVVLADNALAFATLPARDTITLVNTVPSAIRAWLSAEGLPASVRDVLLAGEPLEAALAAQIHAQPSVQALYNLYGPTEATTYATGTAVARDDQAAPSIGRPITGTHVYLLDAEDALATPGAIGALAIGGAGLARGYLHRPAETARRFRPDPFSGVPGARLYHTGDLARWRPDGTIDFLGRHDHQVKLRGFRIELGEIETVLTRHPAVQHAVVTVWAGADTGPRLVAYIVPASDGKPAPGALRAHARTALPDYMVPADFVVLEALPLTPNGKIDRQALPPPATEREAVEEDARLHMPVEEIIAGIWAEVLHRDARRIGRDDDFFTLGGHSLLATQVAARVRAALGIELPLRTIFETPTLAGLAAAMDVRRRASSLPAVPPLLPMAREARERPLPLAFTQQRIWFQQQLTPSNTAYNCPAVLRLRGPLDPLALRASLDILTARHEILRTTFPPIDGVPMQIIAGPGPAALRWIDLAELPAAARESAAEALAAREAHRPFSLDRGPLLRVHAVRLDRDDHLLLVTIHHIICDGWSVALLLREFSALYRAAHAGADATTALPPLPIQYADVAVWQRTWLEDGALDAQLDYWRHQLAAAPMLELPTDRPRSMSGTHRGDTCTMTLPPALAGQLRSMAQRDQSTLFMIMLAAWGVLLGRLGGQDDLVVGAPIAGRTQFETEGLIGCFINTLALRLDLSGRPTFREVLARVRGTVLDAYAHQDVPFEHVVEAIAPTRDPSRDAIVSVALVVQNAPSAVIGLPDLDLKIAHPEIAAAKRDLTIYVYEQDGALVQAVSYDAHLFERSTILRLLDQASLVLARVADDPNLPIASILLDDAMQAAIAAYGGSLSALEA